ncbi:MAG: hypothetical protein ACOVMT_04210 [Caulobacter sp.]
MSDNSPPGLPGPGNDGSPDLSDLEIARVAFREVSVALLGQYFTERPNMAAVDASANLLLDTISVLADVTHPPVVRAALIAVLMETYETAPDFLEVGRLKQALDASVARRRSRADTTPGGIILPPKD